MSKVWWLNSQKILDGLDQSESNHLFHLMHLSFYDGHQVIYSSDLPSDVLFLLQSGELSIIQKTPAQTERELVRLRSGDMFGSLSWIDEGKKKVYAITVNPTQMMVLRKPAFEKLMKFFPELNQKISQRLSRTLCEYNKIRKNAIFSQQYRRIVRILIHYADNSDFMIGNQVLDFPLSYQELAELSQVPIVTVKEILERLQKRNLLTLYHHHLKVCDKIRLLEEI